MERERVYWAIQDKSLNIIHVNLSLKGLIVVTISLQGFWPLVSRWNLCLDCFVHIDKQ